jgi:AbrB family looped-hinge helix DNA binding protein
MAYTLTSKSQVTLPKAIRDHLRVAPGDAVTFRVVADGSVRVEPAVAPAAPDPAALKSARQRFKALRGRGGQGGAADTDALMHLLRGYDDDAQDPGFAAPGALATPLRRT